MRLVSAGPARVAVGMEPPRSDRNALRSSASVKLASIGAPNAISSASARCCVPFRSRTRRDGAGLPNARTTCDRRRRCTDSAAHEGAPTRRAHERRRRGSAARAPDGGPRRWPHRATRQTSAGRTQGGDRPACADLEPPRHIHSLDLERDLTSHGGRSRRRGDTQNIRAGREVGQRHGRVEACALDAIHLPLVDTYAALVRK